MGEEKPRLLVHWGRMLIKTENKRLLPRVDVHTPLRYQVRGTPSMSTAVIDNISSGGLSFIDQHYVSPTTILNLEVNLLARVFNTTGRVVWVTPMPHSYRYRVGVQFVEINPVQKQYVADYVGMRTGTN